MSSVSSSESSSECGVVFDSVDESAAAFLCDGGMTAESPFNLRNRITINSDTPFEFENDFFVGRLMILHREPDQYPFEYRYNEFFQTKKRRWELRWQGKFKKLVDDPVVFGIEVNSGPVPKLSFATRALMSMLIKFSRSLARARGSDLYTNAMDDLNSSPSKDPEQSSSGIKYFRFPIHTSDLILSTPPGIEPPSICTPDVLSATDIDTNASHLFKDPANLPIDNTYTFVFYSMYMDFVSWDLRNVPLGLSGMSLNRIAGCQPISVVMRQGDNLIFRLVIGNRCTSPDWARFLVPYDKLTDFFSIASFFSGDEDRFRDVSSPRRRWSVPRIPLRKHHHPHSPRKDSKRRSWIGRKFQKYVLTPTRFIGTCLKAPVSFVINSTTRRVPSSKVVVRHPHRNPSPQLKIDRTPPQPDDVKPHVALGTPV